GARRRHPPRRFARARVRRRPRPQAHGRSAEIVRRRLHHHELARPRLRPRARLARRRARHHERPLGDQDHRSPQAAGRSGSRGRAGPPRLRVRGRASARGDRRGRRVRGRDRGSGGHARASLPGARHAVLLAGKRLLITGVITKESIAFHAAERAQREGATLLLTSFGRVRRLTERAASRLPEPPEVLELDVNRDEDLEALTDALRERWGGVDGALHAIAFAPEDALGGRFMSAPANSAAEAFKTSAFSLKALAAALEPLMGEGGSIVGMDFDASVAWPIYDWMGVAKAALESVSRYLARDLGPKGV